MKKKTIVYSCSGCSSAAQMANDIAIKIDRMGLAEMSCIAGVGGDVPSLVRTAKNAEQIIGIDGCGLHCVTHCLQRHEITPTLHIDLSKLGVKKQLKTDYNKQDFDGHLHECVSKIKTIIKPI
jgi:uncharacterized metal-binding protein